MATGIFTVPDEETRRRIGEVAGAQVRVWDLSSSAEEAGLEAEAIRGVLIPNYFFNAAGWQRLADLPGLQLVQLPSAGYEHAIRFIPEGVRLANGAGVHDAETAEHAIGLALASVRGFGRWLRAQDEGRWAPVQGPSLVDRHVTVVGFGHVGRAIVSRVLPFEVELEVVAGHTRTEHVDGHEISVRAISDLPEVLPHTEVLILIVPMSDETRHLIGAPELALLPDGAHVINVARGGVVDTEALLPELLSGRLHAALDVTDPEPLPPDHPLWRAPGCLITPHIGGLTDATAPRVAALWRDQIEAMVAGSPLRNLVAVSHGVH
ncbi:MAG: 2-hydroxyacid dehydrogenase [Microbacteriaceae bacterium]|jgi:phosphoglycerate dehydrogenase-like enzyme|nr:2-hydroxyacid dehydrogenase [Microbacteriaceae bacterium]MCI1207813.1 2-hydroxyacid dehydrogenase [Microbacteriaceae bacterium]